MRNNTSGRYHEHNIHKNTSQKLPSRVKSENLQKVLIHATNVLPTLQSAIHKSSVKYGIGMTV